MRSMTGFAEEQVNGDGFRITLRIRSVNGRNLDAQFRLSDTFVSLEPDLLTLLKQTVNRGRITVWVDIRIEDSEKAGIRLNTQMLKPMAREFERLQSEFPALQFSIPLTVFYTRESNLLTQEPDSAFMEQIGEAVRAGFRTLLRSFNDTRSREADYLRKDFESRLERIRVMVDQVEAERDGFFDRQLTVCRERLEKLLDSDSLEEARLVQEAGMLTDRMDISEELTRLRAHLSAFHNEMESGQGGGKKLDFILQEMNREVNTIGSKGRDEVISRHVVDMKTELEKIREQVQNIE